MWVTLRTTMAAESTHTGEMRRWRREVCSVLTCIHEQCIECIDLGTTAGVLRVTTRVRCAERAEEYAIRFVRVTLLVAAQVSAVARADPRRCRAGRLVIRPHITAQTGRLHPVLGWLGR